jgi:hypothetical protein
MKTRNAQSIQIINQSNIKISSAKRRAIEKRLVKIQNKLTGRKWDAAEEIRKMRLRWSS